MVVGTHVMDPESELWKHWLKRWKVLSFHSFCSSVMFLGLRSMSLSPTITCSTCKHIHARTERGGGLSSGVPVGTSPIAP